MQKKDLHNDTPDNLFHDKLHDRLFEFDENYWPDAEKKIQEYEQSGKLRYKKRAAWWWWGGALALLLAVGFVIVFSGWFGDKNRNAIHETKNVQVADTIKRKSISQNITHENDSVQAVTLQTDTQKVSPEIDNLIGEINNALSGKNGYEQTDNNEEVMFAQAETKGDTGDITDTHTNLNEQKAEKETEKTKYANTENVLSNPDSLLTSSVVQQDTTLREALALDFIIPEMLQTKTDSFLLTEGGTPHFSIGKKYHFFAGLHAGYDYVTKTITSPGTSVNNTFNGAYASLRADEEKPILVSSAGLTAGITLRNFNFTTGFTSYTLGEKASFNILQTNPDSSIITNIIDIPVIDTLSIQYDTIYTDTTTYEIDTVITTYFTDTVAFNSDTVIEINHFTTETTITKKDTNLISYFEIPFLFGYEFQKNKWRFNLQTGPSLGIYRYSTGNVINADLESFSPLHDTGYFTKLSYNWLFTPSVGYKLNKALEIQVQPWIRFNLSSVSADDYLKLRYRSYGLHAAVVYHF